jgi:hypothetical protein
MDLHNYSCSGCNKEFAFTKGIDIVNLAPPQVGDILLCADCGVPNIVTLEGTRLMTDEEFKALDKEEAKDLDLAQRSLIKQKFPHNGQLRRI